MNPTICIIFCFLQGSPQPATSRASYCDVMNAAIGGPFRASKQDTLKTRQDADTLNKVGVRLCGWKPKK